MKTSPKNITKRIISGALLISATTLGLPGCKRTAETLGAPIQTSEWLPRQKFQAYLDQKEQKDADGKNFWDRGLSIGKIESRWENGYQQYKISIVRNPNTKGFWWFWYFDMDKTQFKTRISELGSQGYQLISYSSNMTPTGETIFAGVWNKKTEE